MRREVLAVPSARQDDITVVLEVRDLGQPGEDAARPLLALRRGHAVERHVIGLNLGLGIEQAVLGRENVDRVRVEGFRVGQ